MTSDKMTSDTVRANSEHANAGRLMEVFLKDPHNGKSIAMPKGIAIHIVGRMDIVQMLVRDRLRGAKNTDYKSSDMYDLILNDIGKANNLRKDQGLLLLKAQMIAEVYWLSKKTGELRAVKDLRIAGERETMLIVGSLGSGWSMESIDPSYIISCLKNYIVEKDK